MSPIKLLCGVLAVLFAFHPALAGFEENESSVRAEGMAGAFTAVADDIGAMNFNPAGLFQVEVRQFQGFYKLLYGGAGVGLHTMEFGVCLPLPKLGTVGLRAQETGFELEAQRSLKLCHGFQLAEGLGFGYGLNGYNLSQKGLGQGFGFGLDLGLFCRVYRFWTAGFYVHNLNTPRLAGEELPRLLTFGLGFSPGPEIHSALDISKEPGQPTRIAVGQEFRIIQDHLTVRAGVQTEPVRLAFGLRLGVRQIFLDYAVLTHPVMPLTHDLGLLLQF
ncbi:MAG: hypothetical protein ABIK44_04095 [candidate division WOR-3 bacterium]